MCDTLSGDENFMLRLHVFVGEHFNRDAKFFPVELCTCKTFTKEKKNSVILIVADTILFVSLNVNVLFLSDI